MNAGGSPVLVTLVTPATISELDIEDKVVTIASGDARFIGPFEPGLYNQPSGATDSGDMYVEYDQVAGVTVGVYQL